VEIEGRTLGAYFAWLPPDDLRGGVEANARIARLASLAFLGGMAVLLGVAAAAQLARAVLRLERSAVAIAAGDLESRVRVKGAREIVDLAAAMDSMRSGLREDRDRRARFLAAVSHDLRTPLTSIGGYLEAVEDGLAADPATLERYVSIMREKTRLLEARIAGLIEFARMDTGEWRLGFETLDLGTFLESQARVFAEDAILADRSFSSDLGAAAGFSVQADAALLARALENLVSNALRYSPPGSAVRLVAARERRASPPGDVLVLILDDEGPGIAPEERELVFEPFVRGSAAHRGEGAGLGLYIARSVIEGHGWSLRAQEAPGGGCRFVATIAASAGSPGPQLPSGRV
ncbi:MAG: HAMP domain-containing sensor histidine kinase, partial [Spirochaetaceae bacterium]|nr:HAMP domain-containing sensor histidine kinase [Spirochaetaceae bacterium]